MRTFLKLVFVFFGAFIVLVSFLLLLVSRTDFTAFKPQIKRAVASQIEADVDFSKAGLNLLGLPALHFEGFVLKNTRAPFENSEVLRAEKVQLNINWRAFFQGSLQFNLKVEKPVISLVSMDTTHNISALLKPAPEGAAPLVESPGAVDLQQESLDDSRAPLFFSWFQSVSIESIEIVDAQMTVEKRYLSRAPLSLGTLNLDLSNIKQGADAILSLRANFDYVNEDVEVKGPAEVQATAKLQSLDDGLPFHGSAQLTGLAIKNSAFEKPAGFQFESVFTGTLDTQDLKFSELKFTIPAGEVNSQVSQYRFATQAISAQFSGQVSDLSKWNLFSEKIKGFSAQSSLAFDGVLEGAFQNGQPLLLDANVEKKAGIYSLKAKIISNNLYLPSFIVSFTSDNFSAAELIAPFLSKEISNNPLLNVSGTDFNLALNRDGARTTLEKLSLQAYSGVLQGSGEMSHTASRFLKAQLKLRGTRLSQVLTIFPQTKFKDTDGILDFNVNFHGETVSREQFLNSLSARGDFVIRDGEFSAAPLRNALEVELEKTLKGLSIQSIAPESFEKLDKLMSQPGVKEIATKNNIDIEKYKNRFSELQKMKVSLNSKNTKDVRPVEGKFSIDHQKVSFQTSKVTSEGAIEVDGSVTFGHEINAKGEFRASESFKSGLLENSKHASLLFDKNKQFIVPFQVTGHTHQPQVDVDLSRIENNFKANLSGVAQADLNRELDALGDSVSKKLKENAPGNENADEMVKRAIERGKERLKKYLKN